MSESHAGRPCVVVTGPMGAGKTTALRAAMAALAAEGRCVRAVVQPALSRRNDGKATGFSMEFLAGSGGILTSSCEMLACEPAAGEGPVEGKIRFGRFSFDAEVFLLAEKFIRAAMEGSRRAEVIGIDEIGRLELESGRGLSGCLESAMRQAARPGGPLLVLAVREDCAPRLLFKAEASGLKAVLVEKADANACLRAIRDLRRCLPSER